jgi:hypothetical protein
LQIFVNANRQLLQSAWGIADNRTHWQPLPTTLINSEIGKRLPARNPEDLTRGAFRETMQSLNEVKNWIWGYRDA